MDNLPDPATTQIFRTPDHHNEDNRVGNLENLPLLDDQGHEINIYDECGYRIARRKPLIRNDTVSCSLLIDLTRIRALFREPPTYVYDFDTGDLEEELDHPCTINIYPQGYLRRYGHFQVDDVPLGFAEEIKCINNDLAHTPHQNRPLIRGVSCQGYNYVQHCLMHRAGGLELVHGLMTGAMTGATAKDAKSETKFKNAFQSVAQARPHERIKAKLSDDGKIERSIRLEPIFIVDIQALKPEFQNGR